MPRRQNVKSEDARLTDGHERARNFLNDGEVDALLEVAKKGRHGVRDFLILLMMFRHGLRVSEAVRMRRQDLNLGGARVWIRRLKNGLSVEHPIAGDELRAIKRYLHTRHDALPWLFVSESLFHKSSGGDFRRHTWSLAPSDPSHHEPTSGQLHPGQRTCHRPLYVLGKTTAAPHPREGSLHYPTT